MHKLTITFTNGLSQLLHSPNIADLEEWIILWQRWQLGEDVQPFGAMTSDNGSTICIRLQFVVSMTLNGAQEDNR